MNPQQQFMVQRAVEAAKREAEADELREFKAKLADSRKTNKQLGEQRQSLLLAAGLHEETDTDDAAEWIRELRVENAKLLRENARLRREHAPVVHLPEEKR